MKIDVNEKVLLMNKRTRTMGVEPNPEPTTTVSNPESSMHTLEAMGHQNIMFQGNLTKAAKRGTTKLGQRVKNRRTDKQVRNNLKRLTKQGAVFAMIANILLSGCVTQTVNMDMDAFVQALAALTEAIDKMSENDTAKIGFLKEIATMVTQIKQSQDDHYDDEEAFYDQLLNKMVTENTLKKYFGEDSPIYIAIQAIFTQLENGDISAKDAYDQIINLLTNINTNVASILQEAKSFNSKADTIIQNQVEAGNISKERYEEYKAWCEKEYAAIEAGNLTLAEFKQQALAKLNDINNNVYGLGTKIIELVEDGFYTVDQGQEAMLGAIETLNETECEILTQSMTNGENILAIYNKLLEDGEISQTQYNNMTKFLKNWYNGYIADSENTATYRQQVLDNFATVISNQTKGNEILKKFAKTEEANDAMTNKQLAVLIGITNKINAKEDYIASVEYKQLLALIDNNNKLDELLEQGKISQGQRDTMIEALYALEQAQLDGNASVEKYGTAVVEKMAELIKTVSDDDAAILAKLDEILNSNKTTDEKITEMTKLLESIDSTVKTILQKICEYGELFKQYFDTFTNQISALKKILKDVRDGVTNISGSVTTIRQKIGDSLAGLEAQLANISALIEKADANNVETMTKGKEEIIEVLKTLGYEETEILKMSMAEVKAAIEKNGQYIQNNGAVLNKILSFVNILPQLKTLISTKADSIIDALNNIKIDVEISPETLAKLESLFDKYVKPVVDELKSIHADMNTNHAETITELQATHVDINKMGKTVEEINTKAEKTNTYLEYGISVLENMDAKTTNIQDWAAAISMTTDELLEWVKEHGGSGSSVDLSEITALMKEDLATNKANNYVLNLMYAEWSGDFDAIKNYLKEMKASDAEVLKVLNSIDNKNSIIIAAINKLREEGKISADTANSWLETIANKECKCAKDVTIIVEKIYQYLQGNEGIVDYDDLFDDLFGDEEGTTKTVAMAKTPKTSQKTKYTDHLNQYVAQMKRDILVDKILRINPQKGVHTIGNTVYVVSGDLGKTMSVADFYKIANSQPSYKQMKEFRKAVRESNARWAKSNRTFNA